MNQLMRVKAVTEVTTLSRSEIYRRVAAGTFPKQTRLSHRVSVWDKREIEEWIEKAKNEH